jgi:PAS domain S-box-containing protein
MTSGEETFMNTSSNCITLNDYEYKSGDDAFYTEFFENSHLMALLVYPHSGKIKDANCAACSFYGYPKSQMTTMAFSDLLTISEKPIFQQTRSDNFRGTKKIQTRHRLANDETRAVEILIRPVTLYGKKFHHVTIRDIEKRQNIRETLGATENLLTDVFEGIQDGITILDKDLTIQRVNRMMNTWFKDSLPLEGKQCHSCYQNREKPCQPCPAIRCLASGRAEHDIVPGFPDSPVKWIELYSYPLKDRPFGEILGVVEIFRDITDRKLAEAAMQESEEKYRTLVENATEAIFIAQDGAIKFPNPKTLEIIGHQGEQWSDRPFIDFIHPEDRGMVAEMHRRRLSGDKNLPTTYSFRVVSKTGKEFVVDLNAVMINWEGRPATLNFVRDLTEQKKLEISLYQAQKMQAIGTLAGGIAHDFNNLLMGIQGRASLMLADLDHSHTYFEHLKGIEEYVKSATDLTRQLLGFARGGKYEVAPANLNDIIQQSSKMFGRTKREITINLKLEPNLWTSEIDRRQIEQVLLNLYVNAWQAMPGGGELYLQTANVCLDGNFAISHEVKPGKYIKISVTDSGLGMDQSTKARIFEPFFTTKEMGRGTGLGLASAYGIIKNHNGVITVYSEIGTGTTFNVYLPASEKQAHHYTECTKTPLPGTGNILLVDDEALVLKVGKLMLEKLGYRVWCTDSGKQALEMYKQKRKEIDLVLLDMILPEMGGGKIYDKLKEVDPAIKVVLSSGYSMNDQASEIMKKGCNQFIQKPFNMNELSKIIQKAMGQGR